MKSLRLALVAVGLLLLSGAASAQTFGCRGAVSCSGPRGFSTQMGAAMGTYPVFSVGVDYNRIGGLRAHWNPNAVPRPDSQAIDDAVGVFLSRHPGPRKKAVEGQKPTPDGNTDAPARENDPEGDRPED